MTSDRRLIDHHVHGVVPTVLERPRFELLMNEGGMPAPGGTSHFDSPVGTAILTRCAPMLGLEPGCGPDDYLQARADLGAEAVNQLFLQAAESARLLVDTGHRPGEVVEPDEMSRLAGVPADSVTRIERVAEELAQRCESPRDFVEGLGAALDAAAADSVGFKTVVAYRYGFDLDATVPAAAAVAGAAEEWFATMRDTGECRLVSPILLAHLLHTAGDVAAQRRLPLQIHAGFGDTDLTLHRSDPSVFTPWVRQLGRRGVNLIFLHCYPYHRQAGYLAEAYPHVYFDVGVTQHYTGASAGTMIAEALEIAPYTKLLYSSDAFGLAEFAYLSAILFRRHLDRVLDGWVSAGDCTAAIADRIRSLVERDNAARIYPLPSS
jgi:predicted TIM-barrel fold metal-dependent hydrolase